MIECLTVSCSPSGSYAYDPDLVVRFASTLDDPDAPTELEVDGAVDFTTEWALLDVIGWEVESEVIVDPNWGVFRTQRPGHTQIRESEMTFSADRLGNDIRTILQRYTVGFVMIFPSGLNGLVNVYPVRVGSVEHMLALRTGQGARIRTIFTIIATPSTNVAVVP